MAKARMAPSLETVSAQMDAVVIAYIILHVSPAPAYISLFDYLSSNSAISAITRPFKSWSLLGSLQLCVISYSMPCLLPSGRVGYRCTALRWLEP
jgi:hypothetical protein